MSNLNELFPGCEALMEDVEINNNVTVPTEDVEAAEEAGIVAGSDEATEAGEIETDATANEAAATAFAHQFSDLCAMQSHIEKYGVDRTFLSLCNRDNVLGRAFGISMPACESFDSVGSPYSPVSVACMEAMGDSLWQKFKEWIKKIWQKIKNFFIRIADCFREAMGNYNLRLHKYRKWVQDHPNAKLATKNGKISDKEVLLPNMKGIGDFDKKYNEVCDNLQKDLFNNSEWQTCINEVNTLINHSVDTLQQYGKVSKTDAREGVADGLYSGNGMTEHEGSGFTGYDPSKKEAKATGKLFEKIEKLKKKIKEHDLFKFKKQKLSSIAKGGSDPATLGKEFIVQITNVLDSLTEVIKHNEEFERVRTNFSNTIDKNLDKLNNCVQRTDGGSIGAKSRSLVSNQINHVTKVVFKSGIVPVINNKIINTGFKLINGLRECLDSGNALNNE